MSNVERIDFDSAAALAEAAAAAWIGELQGLQGTTRKYCVALSGGRVTRLFFPKIAARAKVQRSLLDPVHFFWADERCVPPDDPESNFAIAQELLFKPLGIDPAQVHRILGENAPELAARSAEEELRRVAPVNAAGLPVFDLIFLGMGEDGHVASLFPGEPVEAKTTAAVYRVVTAVKPPPRRVTLGYPAIAAAERTWVLASGEGKQDALRRSLAPDGDTPLAEVSRSRESTKIFSDIRLH